MNPINRAAVAALFTLLASLVSAAETPTLELTGQAGPGKGKRVVLISGDEEYRSEESLPMLAKILSQRHGFHCTVIFALDPASGTINPNIRTNLPGLEALDHADLMIIATRFRQLPPEQLRPLADYLRQGKPVIGLRTATHAFRCDAITEGFKWSEFGLHVLGETWVDHHGKHQEQGTRGVIEPANANHPVLNGVKDIFGTSDVYTVKNLTSDATVLMRGGVTETLDPSSRLVAGDLNSPMMPLVWLREYAVLGGTKGRALCSTIGAAVDFESEGLRRLMVNATFFLTGVAVPAAADVRYVDPYRPGFYGSIRTPKDVWLTRGLKPADLGLGKATEPWAAGPVQPGLLTTKPK